MPHVTLPEDTFQRLAARAAALNISVDEFVQPTLDQLAKSDTELPLTGVHGRRSVLLGLLAIKKESESLIEQPVADPKVGLFDSLEYCFEID
jgi:hypothetical protein